MWLKEGGEGKGNKRDDVTKDPGTEYGFLCLRKLFKSKVLVPIPLRDPSDLHVFIQQTLINMEYARPCPGHWAMVVNKKKALKTILFIQ